MLKVLVAIVTGCALIPFLQWYEMHTMLLRFSSCIPVLIFKSQRHKFSQTNNFSQIIYWCDFAEIAPGLYTKLEKILSSLPWTYNNDKDKINLFKSNKPFRPLCPVVYIVNMHKYDEQCGQHHLWHNKTYLNRYFSQFKSTCTWRAHIFRNLEIFCSFNLYHDHGNDWRTKVLSQ